MDELTHSKDRVRAALSERIGKDLARRKRRRTAITAAAAVPVLAASVTAGFAILHLTDEQKRFTAICYLGSTPDAPLEEVGYASGGEIVGTNPDGSVMVDISGVPERVDPQELCGPVWSEPAPGMDLPDNVEPGTVPELVTCIRDDWRYAVFAAPDGQPADDTATEAFCEDIGMKPGTIDLSKL